MADKEWDFFHKKFQNDVDFEKKYSEKSSSKFSRVQPNLFINFWFFFWMNGKKFSLAEKTVI